MSTEIDSRIVEMRFDNKHFEENVATSMSTLDRLKEKLKMKDAATGLENISSAAKKVDLSGLDSAIDSVKIKFSSMQVIAATALSNLTTSAINAGKKMTSALVDPLIEGGKKRALNIEQAKFQLEGLGVAWNTIKDDINYGVKNTAYGLDAAAKVASQLVASNVQVGDSMRTALRAVSGVAAMTNSEYEDIGRVFTTVAGNGRLMGDQLQQLSSRGINAAATLANYLGKTEGEIRDMTSKGKIDFATFAAAMDDAFGEHAKEANATFTGSMSNMRAALSRIGADIATPAFQDLRDIFNTLTPIIDKVHTALGPLISDIEKGMRLATDFVINKLNGFSDSFLTSNWDRLKAKISDTGVAFDDFQNALIETAKSHNIAIDDMIQKEGSFENTLKSGWLTPDLIAETLKNFTNGISETTSEVVNFEEVVNRVINGDFGNGVERINRLTEAGYDYATVQGLVNDVLKGNAVNFEKVVDVQQKFTDGVSEATGEVVNLKDVVDQVINGDFGNGIVRVNKLTEAGYDYATVQGLVNDVLWGNAVNFEKMSDAQLESLGYTEEQIQLLHQLGEEAERTGTPLNELILNLNRPTGISLLIDSIRNAVQGITKIINTVKAAWNDVFASNNTNLLYLMVNAIHSFSEKLIMSDENADNLRRTLRGLFSALDIIKNIVTGGLKTAFDIINAILAGFDLNILAVTAKIGDAITNFRAWYKEHNLLATALKKLTSIIKNAIQFVKEFVSKFKEIPQIQSIIEKVKDIAVKALEKIGEMSEKGQEKILSFIDKLKSLNSISLKDIKIAFKGFKDNIFEYFLNFDNLSKNVKNIFGTLKAKISSSLEATGSSFDGLKAKINSFVHFIQTKFSKVGIGEVLTVGFGVSLIASIRLVSKALDKIMGPFNAVSKVAGKVNGVLSKTQDVLKSYSEKIKSESLKNVAISIAILAGSLVVLAQVDPAKVWSAVGALIVLSGALVGITALTSKIGKVEKFSVNILAISAAILMLVFALKDLNKLDPIRTVQSLAVVLTMILGLIAAISLLSNTAPQTKSSALTILAIAVSIGILANALEKIDKQNPSGKSILVLISIMGALAGLIAITNLVAKDTVKAGVSMVGIAAALLILCTAFNKIDQLKITTKTIGNLIVMVGALTALMAATRLAGKNATKAGVGMIGVASSIFIMIEVLKRIDSVKITSKKVETLIGIMATLSLLMVATRLAGKNATKAGASMLLIAISIGLLAGVIAVLSLVDPSGLDRGLKAVSVLGLVVAGIIASTKLASTCKESLITLTVAIGILVAGLGVLAMIEPESLKNATVAISTVLAMFAVVLAASNLISESYKSIIVMTVAITALGAMLYLLSAIDSGSMLASAQSLSLLMLSLSASMLIISKAGKVSLSAIGSLALIGLVVAELATILAVMNGLNVAPSMETAKALSLLLGTMTGVLVVLSLVGAGATAAFTGIGVLAALIAAVGGIMIGLGALMEYVPKCQEWLDTGMVILEKIGNGIGSFFGGIVNGFNTSASSDLSKVGINLSAFMNSIQPFFDGLSKIDESTLTKLKPLTNFMKDFKSFDTNENSMTEIESQLITFGEALKGFGASISGINIDEINVASNAAKAIAEVNKILSKYKTTNISDFGAQLEPFGRSLKAYGESVDGLNVEAIELSAEAASALSELASALPNSGGWAGMFAGNNDIDDFGAKLIPFGRALKNYGDAVDGVNSESIEESVKAGQALSDLANALPNSGGWAAAFAGDNDIADFGAKLIPFGKAITEYGNSVSGIDVDSITKSTTAISALSELASALPNSGGFAAAFAGDNSIDAFGSKLISFGESLKTYNEQVSDMDTSGIERVNDFINSFNALSQSMSNGNLKAFSDSSITDNLKTQFKAFGDVIKSFNDSIKGMDTKGLEASANAGKSIAEISKIASEGKLGRIFSDGNGEGFKADLKAYGEAIKDYGKAVKGMNTENIAASATAANSIFKVAKTMSGDGTINRIFTDDATAEQFKNDMRVITDILQTYGVGSLSIDLGHIEASKEAFNDIKDFVVNIPDIDDNTDNITNLKKKMQIIDSILQTYGVSSRSIDLGNVQASKEAFNDIKDFVVNIPNIDDDTDNINNFKQRMTAISSILKTYGGSIKDIDLGNVQASQNAFDNIKSFVTNIPSLDDNATNIETFEKQANTISKILSSYSINTKDIEVSTVYTAKQAFDSIKEMLSNMSSVTDYSANIESFKEQIDKIIRMLKDFNEDIVNVDFNNIQSATTTCESLAGLASSVSDNDGNLEAFGNSLIAFGEKLSEFSNTIGEVDLSGISANINDLTTSIQNSATQIGDGFVNSLNTAGSQIVQAATDMINSAISAITGATSNFQTEGTNLGDAIASGLTAASGNVTAAAQSVASESVSSVSQYDGQYRAAGYNMAAGLASGISAGNSLAVDAAVNMAKSALAAAKEELGIHSPSRAFMAIGRYIGEGLANGIRDNAYRAVDETEASAAKVKSVAKKSFDDVEKWVEEAKSFDELSLAEELEIWDTMISKYSEGSEERLKAEKNAYTVLKKLREEDYQNSKDWIDKEKDYNRMSTKEELEAWKRVQERYIEGTDERAEIDKKIYDLKHELIDGDVYALEREIQANDDLIASLEEETVAYSNAVKEGIYLRKLLKDAEYSTSKNWIETEKDYNRLDTKGELEAWERVQARYEDGSEERIEIDKKIYDLKHELIDGNIDALEDEIEANKRLIATLEEGSVAWSNAVKEGEYLNKLLVDANYQNSMDWIQDQEDRGEYSLADKLAWNTRMLNKYGKRDKETRKKYEKEIYATQKEIYNAYKDFLDDCQNVKDDYVEKEKELNEKLEQDIKELEDNYSDTLESRIQSLYNAYGLFDKVEQKGKTSVSELTKNLQDQVAEFEDWDDTLQQLSKRGLNQALIEELQEMGPSAIANIRGLNSMTDAQLSQYANLWAEKHKEATDRATDELTDLRKETNSQIKELKTTYNSDLDELKKDTDEKLSELKDAFLKNIGAIKDDTEEKFQEIVSIASTVLGSAGWDELGEYMVDGLIEGVESKQPEFLKTLESLISAGTEITQDTAEIHSPSRVFARIGEYMVEGLIGGITNRSDDASKASADMARGTIQSVSRLISDMSTIIDSDMEITPTISPILDMTNVQNGLNQMDSTLSANRSIALGMSVVSKNQNGLAYQFGDAISKLADANTQSNGQIVDAIDGLKSDLSDLVDRVSQLQVVMDTGELVGAISPEMDRSLGVAAMMKRRGNI